MFDHEGKWLRSIGKKGELNEPLSVSVSEGHVFVGDVSSCRVGVYKKSGEHVKVIGKKGGGEGELGGRVYGVWVDEGELFVSDTDNFRIQIFK